MHRTPPVFFGKGAPYDKTMKGWCRPPKPLSTYIPLVKGALPQGLEGSTSSGVKRPAGCCSQLTFVGAVFKGDSPLLLLDLEGRGSGCAPKASCGSSLRKRGY